MATAAEPPPPPPPLLLQLLILLPAIRPENRAHLCDDLQGNKELKLFSILSLCSFEPNGAPGAYYNAKAYAYKYRQQ